jgi:beta-xylosidase
VAEHDGRFWMYYSAGGEEGQEHQLRVAVADRAEGPFRDSGAVLDPEDPFSIDAHPFQDDDGTWYLFYCRDFLEGERVGTGIVVDRLLDMRTLAADRRVVVRPFADWNLFAAGREWYGRTWDWYTVEGPFVRKRDGRYYCFFSGGAWREPNYGVSYALAEHPLGPWTVAEGDGPTILRTTDAVVGPGHASIVPSPSRAEDWIVYHAWEPGGDARLLRIDRLDWTRDGPRCDGPSLDPRPLPV